MLKPVWDYELNFSSAAARLLHITLGVAMISVQQPLIYDTTATANALSLTRLSSKPFASCRTINVLRLYYTCTALPSAALAGESSADKAAAPSCTSCCRPRFRRPEASAQSSGRRLANATRT